MELPKMIFRSAIQLRQRKALMISSKSKNQGLKNKK
jgi:hypothetical protein